MKVKNKIPEFSTHYDLVKIFKGRNLGVQVITGMDNQVDNRFGGVLTCLWACTWGVLQWTDMDIVLRHSVGGVASHAIGQHTGPAAGAQTFSPSARSSAGIAGAPVPTTHHQESQSYLSSTSYIIAPQ